MAPSKLINSNQVAIVRTTRSQNTFNELAIHPTNVNNKRKNDENPVDNPIKRSRSAFANIANATNVNNANQLKIGSNNDTVLKQEINPSNQDGNVPAIPNRKPKMITRAAARAKVNQETAVLSKVAPNDKNVEDRRKLLPVSLKKSSEDILSSLTKEDSSDKTVTTHDATSVIKALPPGVIDFEKELLNDPYEVTEYTIDIFNYLKEREKSYPIHYYIDKQPNITKSMRLLVIDWMAGVQESFTLHNESLYLAVKILDTYLGEKAINKNNLQLLGAVALFIACKYDESIIPMIDDFVYICDEAYTVAEIISMEIDVFKTIKFDLGFPLSYNFLRRYARCAFISLPILTRARFILEYSLMDYTTITFSDSKMASAALFIALRMFGKPGWNPTLEYYSGYQLSDFLDIIVILNAGMHSIESRKANYMREKYSNYFAKNTKAPLLSLEELLGEKQSMKEWETIHRLADIRLSVDQ